MAKSETIRYIDVDPSNLPEDVQEMLKQDRALYDQQKALRAKVVEAINAQITLKDGYAVTGVGFTRWGQFQLHADKAKPTQAKAGNRPSLADFLASAQSEGRRS